MVQAVSSAISALQALGKKMGVTANNVANATTSASGDALTGVPGSKGRGRIVPRALEESNVDLAEEMVNMTIFQRSYQANLKVIQIEDEMKGDVLDIIS